MNEAEDGLEPVLEAEGLAKTYDEGIAPVTVLNGVSLRVRPAEMVAVVGASGSGKSTLLHLLGGLDRPTAGTVRLAGLEMSSLSEEGRSRLRCRSVGFVFQFHQLLPEFTALENAMMPGWIAGRPTAEVRTRAEGLLRDLGLGARFEHKPAELSGGEQQRVAVARALHLKPAVLLADEPTGNLDRPATQALLEILARYRQEESQAIIIATHNPEVARAAGRVLALQDGYLSPMKMEPARI
ncbi:MAG TPA: ABC transporter ATP-binding protein [Candidatus Limnocylindrales bacterium]|nr:ABC transporter ATP-binding protein [Candidatus Limnocylindrales bacterium]